MTRRRWSSLSALLYGGSLVLHVGLAVALSLVPKPKRTETVAITMTDAKKAKKKEPPKEEPPPPEPPAPKAAKVAPAPKPEPLPKAEPPPNATPPANASLGAYADIGATMGNGPGGLNVGPARPPGDAPHAAPSATATTRRVEALGPAAADEPCAEAVVHARRKGGPQPGYTQAARQANVEGLVRVQVTIDESGRVTSASLAGGLGFGLDEQALAAAKRWSFSPATKCGRPVAGTAVLPFRFKLGS